jgi:hypothetical protein
MTVILDDSGNYVGGYNFGLKPANGEFKKVTKQFLQSYILYETGIQHNKDFPPNGDLFRSQSAAMINLASMILNDFQTGKGLQYSQSQDRVTQDEWKKYIRYLYFELFFTNKNPSFPISMKNIRVEYTIGDGGLEGGARTSAGKQRGNRMGQFRRAGQFQARRQAAAAAAQQAAAAAQQAAPTGPELGAPEVPTGPEPGPEPGVAVPVVAEPEPQPEAVEGQDQVKFIIQSAYPTVQEMKDGILQGAFKIAAEGKDRAPGTATKGTDSWWFFSNKDFEDIYDELEPLIGSRFGTVGPPGAPPLVPQPAAEDLAARAAAATATEQRPRVLRGGSNTHKHTKKRRLNKQGGSKKVTKRRK